MSRPIVLADQIRSPENMGAILRLAGNIGAELCLFIVDENHSYNKIKVDRTSSGASEKVSWEVITLDLISDYIPDDYTIIAIETSDKAVSIYDFGFPEKTVFLVGNEVYGIRESVLEIAHNSVFIPIPGMISSLNVTHALSIGMFEWLRQYRNNLPSMV